MLVCFEVNIKDHPCLEPFLFVEKYPRVKYQVWWPSDYCDDGNYNKI